MGQHTHKGAPKEEEERESNSLVSRKNSWVCSHCALFPGETLNYVLSITGGCLCGRLREHRGKTLDRMFMVNFGAGKTNEPSVDDVAGNTDGVANEMESSSAVYNPLQRELQNKLELFRSQYTQKGARKEGEEQSEPVLSIDGNFVVQLKSFDKKVERTITVKNVSKRVQKIEQTKATLENSLVTLKSPKASSVCVLFPGETVEYVFSITGGFFFGQHRERWIWKIEPNKTLHRTFIINIGDGETNEPIVDDVAGTTDGVANEVESSSPVDNPQLRELQNELALLKGQHTQKGAYKEGEEQSEPVLSIDGNFVVQLQSIDETVERTITVKNVSKHIQKIVEAKATIENSLVTLKNSWAYSYRFLFPGETVEYVFSITGGSFCGQRHERWIWNIEPNKSLDRTFIINIGDGETNEPIVDDVAGNTEGVVKKDKLALLSGEHNNARQQTQKGARKEGEEQSEPVLSIDGNFVVQLQSIDETVERTITVKNVSKCIQKIVQVKATIEKSLVTLKSPSSVSFLMPGETLEYVFSITGGSFFGRHRERWIWKFEPNKTLHRTFIINVGDGETNEPIVDDVAGTTDGVANEVESTRPIYNTQQKELQKKLALLTMRGEYKNALIVPGQATTKRPNFIAYPMRAFHVPPELFELVLTEQNHGKLMRTLGQPPYSLEQPLSAKTYKNWCHHCVYMEEIYHCIALRKHDIEEGLFSHEDNYLALRVENIGEARPSLLVGDVVNAKAPSSTDARGTVFQGVIHAVRQDRVLVKFDAIFHALYKGEKYRISFSQSRGIFRKQHNAIEQVVTNMGMDYLFPETVTIREPYLNVRLNDHDELELLEDASARNGGKVRAWQNPHLNHSQKTAIVNVLRGEARPMPYVIFGPPGTGKTMTTVELIHQLMLNVPACRLIVATPSNSAAYLITERLVNAHVIEPSEIVRLVSANQVERDRVPAHLAKYCATVNISGDRHYSGKELETTTSGLSLNFQAKHIVSRRVTISTCSTVGTLMQMKFPPNHFTHVIIDEAGQSVEPDTLIPLTKINHTVGSVTLVGDPEQLGPAIQSYIARDFRFETSLMERLLKSAHPYGIDWQRFPDTFGYNPRLVTKLSINYRSIPSVLALYNDLFYDSQLVPEQKITDEDSKLLTTLHEILGVKRRTADYGFFVCGIDGRCKQREDSPSWYNPSEAAMVHKIVEQLYRRGYAAREIGIISPYAKQVKTIQDNFTSTDLELPKVGTTQAFQGQERRIIIVSTVRSVTAQLAYDKRAALGFISAPKRVNVAISRSMTALIVVGHPGLLGHDGTWVKVLRRAVVNETYVGCHLNSALRKAIMTETPLHMDRPSV